MSAFVAIKTTLSPAAAQRTTLITRTKKVFSRSRRGARSFPAIDACAAQKSPYVTKAAVDEASSAITETTSYVVETTPNVTEAIPTNIETTANVMDAPAIIFTPLSKQDAEWAWPHAEYEDVTAEDILEDELPSRGTYTSLSFSWPLVPGIPRTTPYDQASLVSAVSRETISAVPATTTIPEVIVTSATTSTIEADKAEATNKQAQDVQTASTAGDELNGLSTISTTTNFELDSMELDGDTEKDANEATLASHESDASLAHTYVHGGDLFTIVEADEPLESSTAEDEMPSALCLLPSPFSRGNPCIKDMDALTSSGPETESSSMTPSFSASVDLESDLFHGLLAIYASLPLVPAFRLFDSLETIPDEFEETLVHSSSSASVMYGKLKQAVSPGDVDALLRSLMVGDDDASLVF